MREFVLILISASLVNNLVLTQMLGVSPLLAVAHRLDTTIMRLALGTAGALVAATFCNWLIDRWLLAPLGLDYLGTLVFVLVAAIIGQLGLPLIDPNHQLLSRPDAMATLLVTNTAILGVALQNAHSGHGFIATMLYGLGGGTGFALALILFAGLRERLDGADVPAPFRGAAIGMITAGLMSLAFMGFAGLG